MKHKILALVMILLVLTGCSEDKKGHAPTTAPTQIAEVSPEPNTEPSTEYVPESTTAPAVPLASEPTVPPTTAATVPTSIIITKHPSSETVSAGGRTWFIAGADNETQITWEFFSPDGTMYSLQQAMSAHPGLILEVLPEDTLGLRQIPASFSGWSARARYDGPGGTAVTEKASITVRDPYGEIIETYRTVHRSGTGNIEKGISELVNNYDFLGYALMDLDGNGVQELILASDAYNSNYPNVIYGIYSLQNGSVVCATMSRARERYFMLNDGSFLMRGSSGAMYSHWITYKFSGTSLSLQEQIWTSDEPHDLADFAPYYYYSIPYGTGDPIVYDEAARTIALWESAITIPALTPIT